MSQSIRFTLPDVGEGIARAEVVQWLVAVGDTVTEDQPIVVIETDKSQLELPAPAAGLITDLRAAEGDVVEVGADLVEITTSVTAPDGRGRDRSTSIGMGPLASPSTRKLAVQLGIDLHKVRGTGPHGRILATDLEVMPVGAGTRTSGADTALDEPLQSSSTDPHAAGLRTDRPPRLQDATIVELRGAAS